MVRRNIANSTEKTKFFLSFKALKHKMAHYSRYLLILSLSVEQQNKNLQIKERTYRCQLWLFCTDLTVHGRRTRSGIFTITNALHDTSTSTFEEREEVTNKA